MKTNYSNYFYENFKSLQSKCWSTDSRLDPLRAGTKECQKKYNLITIINIIGLCLHFEKQKREVEEQNTYDPILRH